VTSSTPITSAAFRANVITGIGTTAPKLNETQKAALADCALKKLEAQGLKTAGEVQQKGSTELKMLGAECAKQLNIHY
jgi:hypothetical protein